MAPLADPLEIPAAVLERFGSPRARPRVVWAWSQHSGRRKVWGRPVLTTARALRLRREGVSTIKLVWRWQSVEMTVTTGRKSVWGADADTSSIPTLAPALADLLIPAS